MLFERGNKCNLSLTLTRNENVIKVVEYLGCLLDKNMFGKTKSRMALKKVNRRKKFLYRQNRYLSYPLKRILCNNLIQPPYDFAYVAPGIQICQCYWKLSYRQLRILVLIIARS